MIADYADDALLVEWSAESEGASLAHAVDTYLIQGGKIIRPTTRFRWIPK